MTCQFKTGVWKNNMLWKRNCHSALEWNPQGRRSRERSKAPNVGSPLQNWEMTPNTNIDGSSRLMNYAPMEYGCKGSKESSTYDFMVKIDFFNLPSMSRFFLRNSLEIVYHDIIWGLPLSYGNWFQLQFPYRV
jgi:hypothetical protein